MQPLVDYSQYGQAFFFRRFIPPDIARWVIDVGAYDGIDGSNSRQLVVEGWNAVLIEPVPFVYSELRKNCSGFPNVRLLNVACSDTGGRATMHVTEGQESSLRPELGRGGQLLEVPTRTLNEILEAENCPREFGVLCEDTEGMGYEVLRGLDLDHFRPAVICTEDYGPTRDEKYRYLLANGYALQGGVGPDSIWTCQRLVGSRSWPTHFGYLGEVCPQELCASACIGEGVVFVDQFSQGTVQGWAVADRAISVPRIVLLEVQGRAIWYVQAARYPRKDVARRFGVDLLAGFRATLPHPAHDVYLLQFDGQDLYRCRITDKLGNLGD